MDCQLNSNVIMREHEKIIKSFAKTKLVPKGFFQKGASRVWIKDNSYYLIVIEFQPSGWQVGTFVNACVSFLWEKTKDLDTSLCFDISKRIIGSEGQFVKYNQEDCESSSHFSEVLSQYIDIALKYVDEWEQFTNVDKTKNYLIEAHKGLRDPFWELYDIAMISFLKGDYAEGNEFFNASLEIAKNSCNRNGVHIEWMEEFYKYCISELQPHLDNPENAKRMVINMIDRRRKLLCSKSAFSKMKYNPIFDLSIK